MYRRECSNLAKASCSTNGDTQWQPVMAFSESHIILYCFLLSVLVMNVTTAEERVGSQLSGLEVDMIEHVYI